MNALDDLFLQKLQWDWVWNYASLIIIIAAGLALILLITLIAVIACHARNKKKFKTMQGQIDKLAANEPLRDSSELRADMRAEIELELREQLSREYKEKYGEAQNDGAAKRIEALNRTIQEKDQKIDELNKALANSPDELYRTLISDLNTTNKELKSEISALKAENMQLQNSSTPTATPKQTAKPAASKPKKTEPAAAPKVVQPVEDDDDEDEIDNEFGDETSAIKVTVKYDRFKMNWVIYRSDTTRTYRRCPTKQEALVVAKDLARRLHAQLVVHKKDGKFQKVN